MTNREAKVQFYARRNGQDVLVARALIRQRPSVRPTISPRVSAASAAAGSVVTFQVTVPGVAPVISPFARVSLAVLREPRAVGF